MIDDVDFFLIDLKSRFDGLDKSRYFLAYSGGKDSHFLYWFIKEYLHDTEIEIVAVNTYMEHDDIRKRIYKYADRVLLPKMKPFEIKEKYGSPCFSKFQDEMISRYQNGSRTENTMKVINGENIKFNLNKKAREMTLNGTLHKVSNKCCKVIKKDTVKEYCKQSGKKTILGVMQSESMIRNSKYKTCFTKEGTFTPIHDMSDEMMDKVYKKYNIELPPIYSEITRTGCMGCPYARKKNTEKELTLLSPQRKAFVVKLFKESYDVKGIKY